jgi:DUF1680 family protein
MASGGAGGMEQEGLVAAVYAPCEVRTRVRGTDLHVVEETDYPFRGMVRITVNPASPLSFPLQLRIPGWAGGATLKVNGKAEPEPAAGTFARVERKWKMGDRVEIEFPMKPRISRGFRDSISVERGPLVFSYGVGEDWVKLRDRGMTADWQIFPTTGWNYALEVNADDPAAGLRVSEAEVEKAPFSAKHAPVKIEVKARKLPDWRAEDGVANAVPQSPVKSEQPVETITLIPYAAAKLRITAFPQCKA